MYEQERSLPHRIDPIKAHYQPLNVPSETEMLPAAAFVKPFMVGHQVQAPIAHVASRPTPMSEQLPSETRTPVPLIHIQRAQVGSEIRTVMEVVLDDAAPRDDGTRRLVTLSHHVPLRDNVPDAAACLHALSVSLFGNVPSPSEPSCSFFEPFRMVNQIPYPHNVHPFDRTEKRR